MIKRIVSGGQTGADQAALDAAIQLDIPHGGWITRGRKTEDGPLPDKYTLFEMGSDRYSDRTEKNVIDSDGTLILSHGPLTGGSKITHHLAKKYGKPCLYINLDGKVVSFVLDPIMEWLENNGIEVLNVAGPRASHDTLIYGQVYKIIQSLIKKYNNIEGLGNYRLI